MDDMRAVMDAVGSERAVVLGITEGGPMSALFAATYPTHAGARDHGLLRAPQLGARLSDRRPPGRVLARAVGPAPPRGASSRSAPPRSPATIRRSAGTRPTSSAAPRPGRGDHTTDERGDRRPPSARHDPRADARHAPRPGVPARSEPLHGRAHPRGAGRGPGRRSPAVGGRAGLRPRTSRGLPRSLEDVVEPDRILTTVMQAGLPEERRLLRGQLAASAGPRSQRPRLRATSTVPRARSGARAMVGDAAALGAGVGGHTGECEVDGDGCAACAGDRRGRGRGREPGEILATSTVQDLVAGSGSSSPSAARSRSRSAGASASGGCTRRWAGRLPGVYRASARHGTGRLGPATNGQEAQMISTIRNGVDTQQMFGTLDDVGAARARRVHVSRPRTAGRRPQPLAIQGFHARGR